MRLDYLSCVLTIVSTILIGRRMWQGWIVTALNSLVLCVIGIKTAQFGLIPANVFCVAMYGYNVFAWRTATKPEVPVDVSLDVDGQQPPKNHGRRAIGRIRAFVGNEQSRRNQHRIRQRVVPR